MVSDRKRGTLLSLRKTGLPATTLLLIVGTISFVIAPTPSHAEPPAEVSERESLRGLLGMEVLVEPLNIEIEQLGLQTVKLQNDIRQRLQKAGITVLTERERLATPTAAMLGVRLEDNVVSDLSAVTWLKLGAIGVVADDNVKHLEDQVLRKVDQFIKDYLAVNLDRRRSDQLKSP
jgi:hypothetical protein